MKIKLRNKRLTIDEQVSLLTDYMAGWTLQSLIEKYGISRTTIYNIVNREIEREAN